MAAVSASRRWSIVFQAREGLKMSARIVQTNRFRVSNDARHLKKNRWHRFLLFFFCIFIDIHNSLDYILSFYFARIGLNPFSESSLQVTRCRGVKIFLHRH